MSWVILAFAKQKLDVLMDEKIIISIKIMLIITIMNTPLFWGKPD